MPQYLGAGSGLRSFDEEQVSSPHGTLQMSCTWIQQVLQKVDVSDWVKTEMLVESFYTVTELTDSLPSMTQPEDYIPMCLLPAQGVLLFGEIGLERDSGLWDTQPNEKR